MGYIILVKTGNLLGLVGSWTETTKWPNKLVTQFHNSSQYLYLYAEIWLTGNSPCSMMASHRVSMRWNSCTRGIERKRHLNSYRQPWEVRYWGIIYTPYIAFSLGSYLPSLPLSWRMWLICKTRHQSSPKDRIPACTVYSLYAIFHCHQNINYITQLMMLYS